MGPSVGPRDGLEVERRGPLLNCVVDDPQDFQSEGSWYQEEGEGPR